jgi:hypothetical protein
MTVSSQQRFTKAHPCPICGGYDRLPRGTGERCYGFLSDDGRFAHCTREEFAGELTRNPTSRTFAHRLDGPCECGHVHGATTSQVTAQNRAASAQPLSGRQPAATWSYYAADGSGPVYQKCRFETSSGKGYALRRPARKDWRECPDRRDCQKHQRDCHDGWIWSLKKKPCSPAIAPVLYNLPLLTSRPDAPVYVAEGEKCCDALGDLGLVAVCNPHGALEWRPGYSEPLRGREVVILADADQPGRDHTQLVARSLWGKARSIKIIDPYPDRNDESDIADWIAERNDPWSDTDTRSQLQTLDAQTRQWRPSQDDSAAGLTVVAPSETNPEASVFLTPEELASGDGAGEVDWLWEGFLAPGHITLLAGKPRASGKSTLTFGLIRALLSGEAFLGFTTRQVKGVVLLSEETPLTLLDKIDLFGLTQCRQLLIAPRHSTARLTWEQAIAAAVAQAKKAGAEVLVVDSFPHFAKLPKDGAKDASLINEAFRPLQAAAAEGLAVLLIHHERKGGGEAGEGVRDSGAIVAGSDIILELGRLEGPTARKLELLSRFRSTPSDFVFDFDKDTGHYTYRGTLEEFQDSRKEVEREAAARKLVALLPVETGLTQKEVGEKANLGKSQAGELLNKAVGMGLAGRTGRGTRNDPYRYSRVDGTGSERGAREETASHPSQPGGPLAGANRDSDVSAAALTYTDRRKQTAGSTVPSPPSPPPPSGTEAASSDQSALPIAPAAGGQ